MTKKTQPKAADAEATFTAIGEVMLDGQYHISVPIPFTQAGIALIAEIDRSAGAPVFKVGAQASSRSPGFARFEKTCNEPVTFKVFRDGEPFQMTVVANMFQVMTMDLVD